MAESPSSAGLPVNVAALGHSIVCMLRSGRVSEQQAQILQGGFGGLHYCRWVLHSSLSRQTGTLQLTSTVLLQCWCARQGLRHSYHNRQSYVKWLFLLEPLPLEVIYGRLRDCASDLVSRPSFVAQVSPSSWIIAFP